MKVPTTGTSVFDADTYTGNGTAGRLITTNFPVDMVIGTRRGDISTKALTTRLTGTGLRTNNTDAEETARTTFDSNIGNILNSGYPNSNSESSVQWAWQRAPGFFDVVCYTGTGSATTFTHNLGVAPELMIVKSRSVGGTGYDWSVYAASLGAAKYASLNRDDRAYDDFGGAWNLTNPTASQFFVGTSTHINGSGTTFVNYLFATCPGVSKVGSYTGTGTTQTINCGFTAGSRFVLIKRTDDTGDWYVWDSARGIVAGNDPYLLLNSTAAEVTNTDYIDTASTGFEISSTAPAAINASGGTFIFLAIA
jgi:hypothetical protein